MSNRKLGLMVELHDRRALIPIKRALARGNGAKAAAVELGVARSTLTDWGDRWPAVAELLKRYTLSTDQVAACGVKARLGK